MATVRYIGNAPTVAQVDTYTPAVITAGNVFTLTIGVKTVNFTSAGTTAAAVSAGLIAALNNTTSPPPSEFSEIVWTDGIGTVIGTAATPGQPFTCASSAATGTGTPTPTFVRTPTTVSSGPNDLAVVTNWSTVTTLPLNSDTIVFEGNAVDALWNLDALTSKTGTTLRVESTYSGRIGLPTVNPLGFNEYRKTYLELAATPAVINGSSGRLRFDFKAATATINITAGATTGIEIGLEAVLIKGTAITNLIVNKGSVAVAPLLTDTGNAITGTAQIGSVTSPAGDSRVRFGVGCGTIPSLKASGGTIETNQAITTLLTDNGSTINILGTAASGNITNEGSTINYSSSGSITGSYIGSNRSSLDFSKNTVARTVVGAVIYDNAIIKDTFRTVTWTGGITLSHCGLKDVNLDLGANLTIAVTDL